MKKFLIYFISILISGCLGAFGMFYLLKKTNLLNNRTDETTKVEKIVTITDTGIADGINNIYDAVVVVENYKNNKLTGIGSGFIYNENGYIMTNQHVIENATEIKVILSSGENIPATLVGSDEFVDIAVIQIDKSYVKTIAKIGNSEISKVGDTVFTIGSPINSNYSGTVTRGILSGKNRMVELSVSSSSVDWIMNVMQTDAAINPGNSGGPLCNVNGEVIGINSMKIVQSEIEGVGFAIPIEDALIYANKVIKGEKIKRAYLGISMGDISSSYYSLKKNNITLDSSITSGVVVFKVNSLGPAEKAGIKKGDVIIKVNDINIKNIAELRYNLYKYEPNSEIAITIIRGTEKITYNVILGESD